MSWFKNWWALDPSEAEDSADNPHAPLRDNQRRDTLPLLTLAFGWGFLVTGLIVGGSLGNGMSFDAIIQWSDHCLGFNVWAHDGYWR